MVTASNYVLTIVTGASESYARCLWQMLRSAERHGLFGAHRFVVFDLGLTPAWRATLSRDFPSFLWRQIDFANYPPHIAPGNRTYAWKPIALHSSAAEFGGLVLWLDSATVFRSSLDPVIQMLRTYAVYTLAGQSALQDRCDPAIWAAARAPLEILHFPERAAGAVGFDLTKPIARLVLDAWHESTRDLQLWSSSSASHRFDQSLLSILVYRAVQASELTLNPGEIDISCASPVRWLSTRNKVSTSLPRWADPFARLWFFWFKCLDRLLLRARHWKANRVDGWHRYPKEHFRVLLGRSPTNSATIHFHSVNAPMGSYYADPFLCTNAGRKWLFVEEFQYRANAGRLVALPLNKNLVPDGRAQPLDIPGRHRSFPFLIHHKKEVFLLPETSAERTVDLYVCMDFPTRWQLRRRLLANVDAADSVLLQHDERWWLFTSVRPHPTHSGRALAIYQTDDLLHGAWKPHPVNAELRYLTAPHGTGRNAGGILRTADGALVRPVHTSERYYGENIRLMQITTLTPTDFEETELMGPNPIGVLAASVSPHHISDDGEHFACDIRDRSGWLPWRWRKRPTAASGR